MPNCHRPARTQCKLFCYTHRENSKHNLHAMGVCVLEPAVPVPTVRLEMINTFVLRYMPFIEVATHPSTRARVWRVY